MMYSRQAELLQSAAHMTIRVLFVSLLLIATTASAEGLDPLRNVSGTASNPGTASPWVLTGGDRWSFFHGFDVHATYVNEVGPTDGRNTVFSTNWLTAGLHADLGDRAFVLLRGRVSLEPYTMSEDDGYPQVLQWVSPAGGGPQIDVMRPHDLIGEAAVQVGFRPSASTLLHLYAAAVGDPALGPPPFALRASGVDFASAPFSYDIQELTHDSTSVVTAGFATRWMTLEGSVFHDAVTTGDHTEIADGSIDSSSVRLTLTPSPAMSLQVSRGRLGEDIERRDLTSASLSIGTRAVAMTALWTRRERDAVPDLTAATEETAFGLELALRGARHAIMGRAEWVDRPVGFPVFTDPDVFDRTAHITLGYLYDFMSGARYRAGFGVNLDYHTQTHDIEDIYGHKPQSIYAFLRLRTAM